MFKQIWHILHGYVYWTMMRIRYRLGYDKVLLVLAHQNEKLDYYALAHLDDFMRRKYAKKAVVLYTDPVIRDMVQTMQLAENVKWIRRSRKRVELLYDFFSFDKFYDNIVFTYIDRPKDNILDRVLEETAVNEEDIVCLGFYRLRTVPALKKRGEDNYV